MSFQPRPEHGFTVYSPAHSQVASHTLHQSKQANGGPYSPGLHQSNESDGEAEDAFVPSPTEKDIAPGKLGKKSGAGGNNNNPVRKRTSRACDSCNQLRTKCDGKQPCSHCTETGLSCSFQRVPKKRGKVSKKDLARQAALKEKAAAQVAVLQKGTESTPSVSSVEVGAPTYSNGHAIAQPTSQPRQLGGVAATTAAVVQDQQTYPNSSPTSNSHRSGMSQVGASIGSPGGQPLTSASLDSQYHGMDINPYAGVPTSVVMPESNSMEDYRASTMDFSNLYMGMGGLPGQALPLDAMEFPINSPSAAGTSTSGCQHPSQIKHPVLLPLLHFLKNIMQPALAFELLEHFFSSASSEFPHPASPYHITTIFRRKSFLGPENPRVCSPGLLASMLWSAAWTSDARALTSPPSARARMCQKLLNLCIFLLNPLVHGDRTGKGAPDAERNGVSVSHPMGVQEMSGDDDIPVKIASGTVDDVATYMHIAIVVSASEDKGASLRWWSAAWNLCKELKLGRELEPGARTKRRTSFPLRDESTGQVGEMSLDQRDLMCEEEREERRRVFWTLYLVDRHLSLCYNRQLTMLDSECVGLLRPMDEMAWQEGVFDPNHQRQFSYMDPRRAGRFEFTGPSTFGFFLPISTVLGEIIDLHQRRMHPFLGQPMGPTGDLMGYDAEVRSVCQQQLKTFATSMRRYRDQHIPPSVANNSESGLRGRREQLTETQFQIATACAYADNLVHVMEILLYDRWDPASLLDDSGLWISTSAFQNAMNHAVCGAEAVADILRYDPQISFIPYLWGIYLLQGSFLLLVAADRLGAEAPEPVVTACETIVRAHEACIVTLQTNYQRAFRGVMQSALAQVRGRMPQDGIEQQRRRRQTLSLYRWISDGAGLAV